MHIDRLNFPAYKIGQTHQGLGSTNKPIEYSGFSILKEATPMAEDLETKFKDLKIAYYSRQTYSSMNYVIIRLHNHNVPLHGVNPYHLVHGNHASP